VPVSKHLTGHIIGLQRYSACLWLRFEHGHPRGEGVDTVLAKPVPMINGNRKPDDTFLFGKLIVRSSCSGALQSKLERVQTEAHELGTCVGL